MPRRTAASARTGASDFRPRAAGIASNTGGRLSVDTQFDLFGMPTVMVRPRSADDLWTFMSLDNEAIRHLTPGQLIEMLADLSPEVSRALWDFMRFCNPGWTVTCLNVGSTSVNKKAQAIVDGFFATLTRLHGSPDVVLGRLFMAAFLRGTMVAELVLDLDGREMVDLATPDPASIRYLHEVDPVRGPIYVPVQWQNRQVQQPEAIAGFVPLTRPTIWLVPIDPFPGDPYGRSLVAPAIFSSLFLLGLLHDLRRVISQQGYPRLDVSLDTEKVLATLPATVRNDPEKLKAWMDATITEVIETYQHLKPADAYVHWDISTVNRPVGAVNADSLGAVDGIIQAIERMATRALKTMPFLMASSQSSSETQANREWEVQAAGIKSIQHYAENMLSGLLQLGLQASGEQADVTFQFAELRAAEMMRDQQTLNLQITNAAAMYDRGWVSQDEASLMVIGHKADEPEPRLVSTLEQPDPDGQQDPATAGNGGEDGEEADSDSKGTKGRSQPLRVVGGDA